MEWIKKVFKSATLHLHTTNMKKTCLRVFYMKHVIKSAYMPQCIFGC